MLEVLILAAIALFVLSRLYVSLGRDDGPPDGRQRPAPGEVRARAQADITEHATQSDPDPGFTGPGAAGLEAIHRADSTFEPTEFLRGARSAYEMIVRAFADGDREALRPLLDDDVYATWDKALTAREESGAQAWQLLRVNNAEIQDAELDGSIARVIVHYRSELGDGERTRQADESWTFKRDVNSGDPNWLLDDVESAA
jgi:predicted lipid-binding transport protein (Tim44 family)